MLHVKGRRVLVKPDPVEDISEGGIILSIDKRLERTAVMKGTVLEIGHLCWKDFTDETPWCQVGDWVMYSPYAGQIIKVPGTKEEILVMNDEDILGTIDRGVAEDVN